MPRNYVGRFAPSPTGPLHLGSLLTAAASFLHARQQGGRWLLRIENIDPPREQPGAIDAICRTLDAFDLHWDDDVELQMDRIPAFRTAVESLLRERAAFRCICSRRQIQQISGSTRYPGTCRDRRIRRRSAAIRVRAPTAAVEFDDALQGHVVHDIAGVEGDFVVFRRDDLPAYHLAVVVDDAAAAITDVVRGNDLLEQTAVHIALQRLLGLPTPLYWHMPVLTTSAGDKLSKRTGAQGVDDTDAPAVAARLLMLLGLDVPRDLVGARPRELWSWAADVWSIDRHRGRQSIRLPD